MATRNSKTANAAAGTPANAAAAAAAGQPATNANGQQVQPAPAAAAAPVQPARAGLTRTLAAALRGQGAVQAQQGNMWLRLNVAQWAHFGAAVASLPQAQQAALAQAVQVAGLPQAQQQAAGKAVNVRVYNDQTAVVFVAPATAYGLYCWYAQQANNSLRIGAQAMYKQFAKQGIGSAHYGPQFGQPGFGSVGNNAA